MRELTGIKRLVLDVLKPHNPSMVDLAVKLSKLEGVNGVNLSLYEVDQKTETVKVTIEGNSIEFEKVKNLIESQGASIHSVDEIAAGKILVEEVQTLQDR